MEPLEMENGLADGILRGEIADGSHVVVSAAGKTLTFQVSDPVVRSKTAAGNPVA